MNAMSAPGITICICTYRRPDQLLRLLKALQRQDTRDRFSYSIVVTDNDHAESARDVVLRFAATSPVGVTYCVESEQNIALARNRALAQARGDFVAFIDDDEFPGEDWLAGLLNACETFGADGALGPVRPFFDNTPPWWLVRSGLCERPQHPTGTTLRWRETRTGNVLLHRLILKGIETPFRREFGSGGEDQDFFRRMIERGHRFVWCNEAAVYEVVPLERQRRRYFLKRALLRGQSEAPLLNSVSIVKSAVAVPAYIAVLPVVGLFGQDALMACGVRLCDHAGKLLAAIGIRPIQRGNLNGQLSASATKSAVHGAG